MTRLFHKIQKHRDKRCRLLKRQAFLEAVKIAGILRREFSAQKVVLYGSLARKSGYFDAASDIDLAVTGLGERYFQAYGRCLRLGKFNVDIKPYECMSENIKEKIKKEGTLLYERE